ncbi:MAG TPA: hypothetical protein VGG10_12680 [Rhizomicrobium sp.]
MTNDDQTGALADHWFGRTSMPLLFTWLAISLLSVLVGLLVIHTHPHSKLVKDAVMVWGFVCLAGGLLPMSSAHITVFPDRLRITKRGVFGWLFGKPRSKIEVPISEVAFCQNASSDGMFDDSLIVVFVGGKKLWIGQAPPYPNASFEKVARVLKSLLPPPPDYGVTNRMLR